MKPFNGHSRAPITREVPGGPARPCLSYPNPAMSEKTTFFGNLRIGYRIGLAFLAVIAVLALLAALSLGALGNVNQALTKVTRDAYPKVKLLSQITNEADAQARYTRNMLIFDNPDIRAQETRRIQESRETVTALFSQLSQLVRSSTGVEMLEACQTTRANYMRELDRLLQLMRDNHSEQARDLLETSLRPAQQKFLEAVTRLSEHQQKVMAEDSDRADAQVSTGRVTVIAIGALAAVLAMALCWLIARSITRPLHTAVQVAEAVAGGDLTSHIPTGRRDEVGQLLSALARMNDSLVRIVGSVRAGSDSIATGTVQIANGNADPEPAHGRTGQQPGRNRRLDGGTDLHRGAERRIGPPGPPTGIGRLVRRGPGRRGGAGRGAHDGLDPPGLGPHGRHHRHHQRHRLPDQHPGAQRRGGKPPARANRAVASPWWRPRCAASRNAAHRPPRRSRA